MDAAVQGGIDAPPAKGRAKVLGVARVSGTDVVLALRNGICEAAFLPAGSVGPTTTAPASFGAQRPVGGDGDSDSHGQYPGTVLAGHYTRATSLMEPFAFADLGCSEDGMALRLEGVGESEPVRKVTGDSLTHWRSGRDVLMTVGNVDRAAAEGVVGVR
ncbi:hypothetical protein [Streptomyces sp. SP17BM10]|uniref:hypothetical protein n=1 Tax=Streptomyces sp. SP17BM10 TaxID=3002530 RepID=UPI002E7824C5|nr:hypothetical protein [Streptomyces sp. SP17BM10]